jgi:hypothetical protein
MRPDDQRSAFDELMDPGLDLPFDAALESLDDELAAAGRHARRMLYGRTQPTRLFSNQLRAHLLGTPLVANATPGVMDVAPAPVRAPALGLRDAPGPEPVSGRGQSRRSRPSFAVPLRTFLAMLAVAGMTAVLALGALSGTFGPPLP